MSVPTQESLNGTINRFLFQDLETGYAVLVLELEDQHTIVAKGAMPPLQIGQDIELLGRWVMDAKYGRQFEVSACRGSLPTSIHGLKKFLGSGLIKGIGKAYAEKLVNHFGSDVLKIIDQQPQRLGEVGGIAAKRVEAIALAWKEHKEIADVMIFLQDKGISPALAARIYKHYKHNTVAFILQNPYRMAEEVWGIGFKTADDIAQKLGFALDSPQRITAGVLFALYTGTQQGHLYSGIEDLKQTVLDLLKLTPEEQIMSTLQAALCALYDQGKVKLVTYQGKHFLTMTRCYVAENGIASKINALIQHSSQRTFDIDSIYTTLSTMQSGITLTEDQIKGILTCLQHKVTVITGGPGTGKTTLIQELLKVLESSRVRYKLAAPTGRAAKRMSESTKRSAMTLHRLLDFDPLTLSFKHNESNALAVDFLIIDEASMIDIFLAHALIRALPQQASVLFIGDVDQLPAVGPGNFLNDCISSGIVPCVRLTEVFRQARDSLIITNAHRINKGEFPVSFMPGARADFCFIKESDATTLPQHLKRILFSQLARYSITPSNAIVLCPMNRGAAGTHLLNQHLQQLLNPGPKEQIVYNGICFKVGDRVMQIRNNYDKFIFNGDIGFLESIKVDERTVVVNFSERLLEYEVSELNELVLAYAITIHKSQGSEYPAVIIPLFMQHFTLLQRNLVYTALTRARSLCILIGEPKALAIALNNNKGTHRLTFLRAFLRSEL